MTVFGEPIGTWISIAAILISISTLLLTLRKQKYEERTALAGYIAKIKSEYGEVIRIIDDYLTDLVESEKILSESAKYTGLSFDVINDRQTSLTELKSRMKAVYDKLGYYEPRTTDPVLLSAIAIESDSIKKTLEQERNDTQNRVRKVELSILHLQEMIKAGEKKSSHQNSPKKQ